VAEAPYERGDVAAWMVIDPDGMRVYRAEVIGTDRLTHEEWRVMTTHGESTTDSRGVGASIVPIDEEIARDFAEKGDGFLVEPVRAVLQEEIEEQSLDQEIVEQSLEQDLNRSIRGNGSMPL
jgi:hypothetical protein